MNRGRYALLAAAGILVVAGLYHFIPAQGPRYDGKPIQYWFSELCRPVDSGDPHPIRVRRAEKAFLRMETNALPYLVGQALDLRSDSLIRIGFYKLLGLLPASWHPPRFVSRDEIRGRAAEMIAGISFHAPPGAVLPLVQKALDAPDPRLRLQALEVLRQIFNGRELHVPYFARALRDSDPAVQTMAADWLENMGDRAAVPALVEFVQRHGASEQALGCAVRALANCGTNATIALPLLQRLFAEETNEGGRALLAAMLCRIDAKQSAALTCFTNYLVRLQHPPWSEFSLKSLGPSAPAAVLALVAIMNGTNTEAWQWIVPCLAEIGAPAELYVPKLRAILRSDDEGDRLLAARDLLARDPADQESQAYLIGLLRDPQSTDDAVRSACLFLGRAGERARSAIPALLTVFARPSVYVWLDAADALNHLGASQSLFLPLLTDKLKSSNAETRRRVAAKVLELTPGNGPAQLALVELFRQNTPFAREALDDLVRWAKPPSRAVLAALREAYRSPDRHLREAASWAINELAPNAPARP